MTATITNTFEAIDEAGSVIASATVTECDGGWSLCTQREVGVFRAFEDAKSAAKAFVQDA